MKSDRQVMRRKNALNSIILMINRV